MITERRGPDLISALDILNLGCWEGIDARWKLGKQTYCWDGEGRTGDSDASRIITTEGLVEHWNGRGMIEKRVRMSGERAREETDLLRIES